MRSPLAVRRPHTTQQKVNWRKSRGKHAKNAVRRMQDWQKTAILIDPIAEKRRAVLQALAMFIEQKVAKEINEEEKARRNLLKKQKAEKEAKEEAKKKEIEKKKLEKEQQKAKEEAEKKAKEEAEYKKWKAEQEEAEKRHQEELANQKKEKKKTPEPKQAPAKTEKTSKGKKMEKAEQPQAAPKEEPKVVEEPVAVAVKETVVEAAPVEEKASGKKNKKNKRASESEKAPEVTEPVKEEPKPVEEPVAVVKETVQEAAPAQEKSGKKNKKNKRASESEKAPEVAEPVKEEPKPVEEPVVVVQETVQEAAPAQEKSGKKNKKNKKHSESEPAAPKEEPKAESKEEVKDVEEPCIAIVLPPTHEEKTNEKVEVAAVAAPAAVEHEAHDDKASKSKKKNKNKKHSESEKTNGHVANGVPPQIASDAAPAAPAPVEGETEEAGKTEKPQEVTEEVITVTRTTALTTDPSVAAGVVELDYGDAATVKKEKADSSDTKVSKSSKKKGKKGRNSNSKTIAEPEITIIDHDEADAEIAALNAGTPSPPIQVHEISSTHHTDATHKETVETVIASAIVDQKDVSPTRFAQNVQALVEKTLKQSHPDVQFDPAVKMQIDVQLQRLAERRPVVEARNVITPLPLQLHVSRPSTPSNRERMYKLLPKDIIFCSGLIESHGDNYNAMASDPRNIYKENARGLQRKIRIFKESPHYQTYLKAKEEGVSVESLLAAAN